MIANPSRPAEQLKSLLEFYQMVEELAEQQPHRMLSVYKACMATKLCSGLPLVDYLRLSNVQMIQVKDRATLKPALSTGPGIVVFAEGQCDLFIVFMGVADLNDG